MQDHPQGEAPYNPAALPICSWPSAGDRHGGQVGPFVCQGHSAVSTVGLGLIPRRQLPTGLLAPHRGPSFPRAPPNTHCPRLGGCGQHSCLLPAQRQCPVAWAGQRPSEGTRGLERGSQMRVTLPSGSFPMAVPESGLFPCPHATSNLAASRPPLSPTSTQ